MYEDRLRHLIAVARKMVEIAKVKFEWWRY